MAKLVKQLEIYTGDFEEELFRESSWRESCFIGEKDYDRVGFIHQIFDNIDKNDHHCDPKMLSEAFAKFPDLDSLHIMSYEYPFFKFDYPMNQEWGRMWMGAGPSMRGLALDIQQSTTRYRDILVTDGKALKNPLRELSLDMVLIGVFMKYKEERADSGQNLRLWQAREFRDMGIRDLKITIWTIRTMAQMSSPMAEFGTGLSVFISLCRSLESLDLSFEGPPSSTSGLLPIFFDFIFPHLKILMLNEVCMSEKLLSSFVMNHSETLKQISVKGHDFTGIDPEHSWRSVQRLIAVFRDNIRLEKVQLICTVFAAHIYDDLYDQN